MPSKLNVDALFKTVNKIPHFEYCNSVYRDGKTFKWISQSFLFHLNCFLALNNYMDCMIFWALHRITKLPSKSMSANFNRKYQQNPVFCLCARVCVSFYANPIHLTRNKHVCWQHAFRSYFYTLQVLTRLYTYNYDPNGNIVKLEKTRKYFNS